jgi:hypothetical protein
MDELAPWGTVRKMREIYGIFAAVTALQRAKRAYAKGELEPYDQWTRIAELLSAQPVRPSKRRNVGAT